ncbi:MAG TPA: TetR/AcrR family transcriptional regulator [Polyangiales bacterium]|nr:TetR/AcrR family transcriptional regulator [Polyangiales bacterium]
MELIGPRAINLGEAASSRDRRGKIVLALYRCMGKKGYAATTLCDIAEEAGMSSSHLLYYYPGKEAILEAFFRAVTSRIEHDIHELQDRDAAERIEAIADLFLSAKGLRKADQGVMLDLYGQAVQNKAMRRIKVAHDRRIKDVFVRLFSELSGANEASAEDAAQTAYATLLGLRANSFYDAQLSAAQANRLFKEALLRLAGLPTLAAASPSAAESA